MASLDASSPLALVFTDIEGSSVLWEEHQDDFLSAFEAHNALLCDACQSIGGQVIHQEGDAFFCVFAHPQAALRFALQSQESLASYDWSQHQLPDLRVRLGLHYGLAHEHGGNYFGSEVNRASRICAAGHGGQILASEELLEACGELGDGVRVTDLSRHRLRGLSEPQHLFQVTRAHWPQQEWPLLRTLDDVPTNLPAQVTSFVGREEDLERLAALLTDADHRLITLTGPGGSGKSRLAQQAAAHALERFPDGVFWISLAEFTTVEAVPAAIMEALRLQPQAGQSPAQAIAAHAHERQLLLVLDNFEHLVEAADFLAALLRLSAEVRLLVTSREVLHLRGEQLLHVLPLGLPEPPLNMQTLSQYDSVHLFLHRAREVSEDFAITADNAAAIAEICLRLDGIPLALELAAAWVRVYPPLRILQRLGGRSQVLTSRVRGVAERQRTVADTIDWSYRLLSPEEQRTLRRLSVFQGGFFLEAAEAVCGPDAVEHVMTLYDKSLLYAKEALGQQRFHMLETIREFAQEKLVEAGEADETRRSHWTYYADWAEGCGPDGMRQRDGGYWTLVALKAPNVEAAVRQAARQGHMAEAESLLALLQDELEVTPSAAERLLPLLDEVLRQVPGHEGQRWPAIAASVRLVCLYHGWRYEEGLSRAEEAFALADATGDDRLRYACAFWASGLATRVDRAACLRWTRELGRWVQTPHDRGNLAARLWRAGDAQGALAQADRAVAESRDADDPRSRCFVITQALTVYLEVGEFRRGRRHVAELVQLVKGPLSADPAVAQYGWRTAIPLVARCGDTAEAARLARDHMAVIAGLRTLEPGLRTSQLLTSVLVCTSGGLWNLAAELADQHLGPWPIADLPDGLAPMAGANMARIYARGGDRQQAMAAIAPLLQTQRQFDEEGDIENGAWLYSVAEVLRVCGKLAEAVQVTLVAVRLQSLWPFRKLLCEELLELLAAEMPADAFARAKAEGEAMTGAQAFALGRKTLGV
ncbi:adenylate/guanylate cyclase domain-containing protein [bacterium]|nr:adenylate/guanylate cyclase domain-containing protein [bacterium]